MDELLTDLVPFNGNMDAILDWDNFTIPTVNSLHRMLRRQAISSGWISGISYRDLTGLKISDLTDFSYIDQREKAQILGELRDTFSTFEADGLEGGATSALTFGTISSANSSAYSDSLNFSCA